MNENQTISEKELLDAIKNLLRKNGHLNKFQAEIRAKVTEILQEQQMSRNPGMKTAGDAPKPTDEVLLINELVREYLEWNGYLYTAGVLSAEAALSAARAPRAALCAAVGVRDDERSAALPLLANVLAAYAERVKRKINKSKKENDYGE